MDRVEHEEFGKGDESIEDWLEEERRDKQREKEEKKKREETNRREKEALEEAKYMQTLQEENAIPRRKEDIMPLEIQNQMFELRVASGTIRSSFQAGGGNVIP